MKYLENVKVGDVVAYCYAGHYEARRIRNVTITKVAKTFIEIEDGSRFSVSNGKMLRDRIGTCGMSGYYLDLAVSYWDSKAQRDKAMLELKTGFEDLINAARNHNWEQVKTSYAALSKVIEG